MEKLIYVDTREPETVVREFKRQTKKGELVIKKLDHCDIMSGNEQVGIERKTPEDMWNRVIAGEWDKQMQGLQDWAWEQGTCPWLLIEGSYYEAHKRTQNKMPIKECKGAAISAAVRYGVSVWNCDDLRDLVSTAIRICRKADEGKLGTPKRIPFAKKVTDSRVGVVMNTFRLTQRQAKSLLHAGGNVKGVFEMKESEIAKLQWLGNTTAKRICKLRDRKYK